MSDETEQGRVKQLERLSAELAAEWKRAEIAEASLDALRAERDALAERVRGLEEALNDAASELHTARQRCDCYSQMTKHPSCVKRLAVENRCYEALRPDPAPASTAGPATCKHGVHAFICHECTGQFEIGAAPSPIPEKPGAGGAMTASEEELRIVSEHRDHWIRAAAVLQTERDAARALLFKGGGNQCVRCGIAFGKHADGCPVPAAIASPSTATAGNDGERGE